MTWCERCAVGIHFYCANDHALEHSGDDHIGNYRAKDIAAKSVLCHDCWSTYKPYVDESDEEEIEGRHQPRAAPQPPPVAMARPPEGSARRRGQAGTLRPCRGGRQPGRRRRTRRAPAQTRKQPLATDAPRVDPDAQRQTGHSAGRRRADPRGRRRPSGTRPGAQRPPSPDTPPRRQFPRRGATRLPCPPPSLRQYCTRLPSPHLSHRLILGQRSLMTTTGLPTISRHDQRRPPLLPKLLVLIARVGWGRRSIALPRDQFSGPWLFSTAEAHTPGSRKFCLASGGSNFA